MFEITAQTPNEPGMKALAVRYNWNFRDSKWIDMGRYRGDGTGMSVETRAEAEADLPYALANSDGLVRESVEISEWNES